ncbi:bifunctional riboflavin kinase/FAD synthetase [Planctomicrobium sp.]|jgi:riboflavin kinase / FMN adenylyltransferase|nr:bifunctional riboflavin kinase/FAD synthetase [Planctomicrobium sp.]MBT5020970.1 bifunctional riboflavin kinase/FAD synthetase [Planctomicrobium sp.]MDB4731214.1 bifunctional riboflavin kinase/FAD synthetase [bacterium]MDB4742868.1 bifunctional riboflavin kinase/FAD synthetase [Planctomicrobium sp.]
MPLHNGLKDFNGSRDCFLSIGNFDGVHLGHQSILSRLVELAQSNNRQSVVLTFEPHPIQLLRPEFAPPRLTSLQEKTKRILATGVDHVVVYPTDEALLNLTAEEFFQQIVVDHFHAQGLVEGPNFFFGKNRAGNIQSLAKLCDAHEMSLNILSPLENNGEMTSSSAIRKAIENGDMRTAKTQLGRAYSISGKVIQGDQRGRTIGFPTANLSDVETLIPADGVYAARVEFADKTYSTAVNIGPNPTFGIKSKKIEAHLLNFNGDLYGRTLQLEFIQQIRSIQIFNSAEDLKQQINQDLLQVREILSDVDE